MEDYLLNYLKTNNPTYLIIDLIEKLKILKNETNNFSEIIKEQKIVLNYKTIKIFYDFLYAFKKVYKSINFEELLSETQKIESDIELKFWNNIIKNFIQVKIIEDQTKFLKELDFEKFKDLIEHTFNNYILYNGIISDYKDWNRDDVKIAKKTINTFLECVVTDFNNYETVIFDLDYKLEFSNEKYQYIWYLCEKNKMYLIMKNLTEKITELYDDQMFD